LFTVVLTVLVYWLLGFIVDDIGSWPGPQYADVEQRMLDQTLVARSRDLQLKIADIEHQIRDQRARQKVLADSTANSKETMNQLLEIQRLALQKNVTPTPEELKALADSEELFLSNQKQYQILNEDIASLNVQSQDLDDEHREIERKLDERREPIQREFEGLQRRHELKVAAVKLGALAPFLAIAFTLFVKKRDSLYAPLIYAFGVAVLAKIVLVMHEYFPTRYFKYILILACLAVVVRILIYLLKMIAYPKRDWLLKQYREAYEAFLCPVCDYPIRRGPLKYLVWNRRNIRKLPIPMVSADGEERYSCPMCGTALYEKCSACHAIRHSLLPACEKCGAVKAQSTAGTTTEDEK
jgi:predicted RNA-binding Zn-ribbon protein involved in translation (DUF1610 family)